jgi:hypothetical protein
MKMTKFIRKNVISLINSELSRKNVPYFVILQLFLFYEFLVLINFVIIGKFAIFLFSRNNFVCAVRAVQKNANGKHRDHTIIMLCMFRKIPGHLSTFSTVVSK